MDQQEAIEKFISTTGCNENDAEFYLESCNWDLNQAINNFFEEERTIKEAYKKEYYEESSKKINTLNKNSSKDENNKRYTGGKQSGQMVEFPDEEANQINSVLDSIIKQASFGKKIEEKQESNNKKSNYFKGHGYSLKASGEKNRYLQIDNEIDDNTIVERQISLWKNGFTIEQEGNAPKFYLYQTEEGREFLRSIERGVAPIKLLNLKHEQQVEVKLSKNMDQDYIPPSESLYMAFSGAGNRLGGYIPSYATTSENVSTQKINNIHNNYIVNIDESKPTTTIQIILFDGKKIKARFNLDHTVFDIRTFIDRNYPSNSSYRLQQRFPAIILNDNDTLEQANLKNTVIFMRKI